MDNISVIIPTYNRLDSLTQTLSYLEKSTVKPQEVLIVDQSNQDFAVKIQGLCNNNSKLNIQYFHLEHPSLTAARNVGIANATGEVLVMMDDDVDVQPDTMQNVITLFQDENLVLAGGLNSNDVFGNSKLGYIFGKSKWSKRHQGHVASGVYGRFPLVCGPQTPTEWVMGFFYAVRRSFILESECRLDEHFQYYAYAEDMDFSYGIYLKAVEQRKRCIMSNLLRVRHNVSTEYRTPARKTMFMSYVHRYYICKKYGLSTFKFWWSNFGDLFYRILKRESLKDYFSAVFFLCRNHRQIKQGNFLYEKFM